MREIAYELGVSERTSSPVRVACAAANGCIGFLAAYGVLHLLHVANSEPPGLLRLSSIPLFATSLGSLPWAALAAFWGAAMPHRLPGFSRLLTVVCGLFALELALWP